MNFFFNHGHRHRRKTYRVTCDSSFDDVRRGPRFATRNTPRNFCERVRAAADTCREYINRTGDLGEATKKKKIRGREREIERKREEEKAELVAKFVGPWPFFVASSLSFNERPSRERRYPSLTAETVQKQHTA